MLIESIAIYALDNYGFPQRTLNMIFDQFAEPKQITYHSKNTISLKDWNVFKHRRTKKCLMFVTVRLIC